MRDLILDAAERAAAYLETLPERAVPPTDAALARLQQLHEPLPAQPTDPAEVLRLLDEHGSDATVASAGGRYFGFVTGGSLPATVAAEVLSDAWDQNGGLSVMSPVNALLEEVSLEWLREIFAFPRGTAGGFVTGCTMANFTGLAAARHALLAKGGWNVEAQGLFGAPPLTVVVGDEVHVSLLKALSLLGLGNERVVRVPVDGQGRMRADALPRLDESTIVCAQVGNVNTGACDPMAQICAAAREAGAWVHVDGAFGLWAAAAPQRAHLVEGVQEADSWATDGHKWLNLPYDSGIVFCREASHLTAAMAASASYLMMDGAREPLNFTPEMSRGARGIAPWAALRSLGRSGLADLIERTCAHATHFADALRDLGCDVLNEVTLNQVLVAFGDDETTRRVIHALQREGTCWCGGTVWRGRAAMRISVSSWATTADDVERSLDAMRRVLAEIDGEMDR